MSKPVLLTGAFGFIGTYVLRHLLNAGHRVICLDLNTPKTTEVAAAFTDKATILWGDLRDEATVKNALKDAEVVVHIAAIIPPLANTNEALATSVNLDATRKLVGYMEQSAKARRLIFASSMAVVGSDQSHRTPPMSVDEPPQPDDHYGRTKADCEKLIHRSDLQWTILRIGACSPEKLGNNNNPDEMKIVFDCSASGRVEFVNASDAALAFANAVDCDAAIGKTLFVGGGPKCQTVALEYFNRMFDTMGLGPMPASAFRPGAPRFFGDWLDTRESQALLKFQRHTLEDYYEGLRQQMGGKRLLLKLLSPLINRMILRASPHYGKRKDA